MLTGRRKEKVEDLRGSRRKLMKQAPQKARRGGICMMASP
jgi:hypothetical protein